MTTEADKNGFRGLTENLSAALTALLHEKQRQIEEATGEKLPLETVFNLYKDVILGKEREEDIVFPGQHRAAFPDGLPGYRFS